MLPSTFVFVEDLPRNANGKIDPRALPVPHEDDSPMPTVFVAPRNDQEQQLANILAEVLGVSRVGIHYDFFDLGGASIQSLEVASRAKAVGLPVEPEYLFAMPTIAELSASFDDLKDDLV